MIATAPNPLAPGFPRTWPECVPAMRAIARHLLAHGGEDEEVMLCLMMDFPALPEAGAPVWRSDARYANIVAEQRMWATTHPDAVENQRDEPSAYELQVVTNAADLIRLCLRYGLVIGPHDAPGDLRTSRKVQVGGPVYYAIKRYKPEFIALLEVRRADG